MRYRDFSLEHFLAIDLIPSLFKYPCQIASVKISPVNARVRPAKPAKREKGKGRRGERTRDGKISIAREGRRERKDEEIEGEGERERRERGERGRLLTRRDREVVDFTRSRLKNKA